MNRFSLLTQLLTTSIIICLLLSCSFEAKKISDKNKVEEGQTLKFTEPKESINPRIKYTINSAWQFHKGDIEGFPSDSIEGVVWDIIPIPHTWNAEDVMDDEPGYYRGISWYKKILYIPESLKDKQVSIYFEGANQEVEVFVNGYSAGKHIGGYTAFSFPITEYLQFAPKNGKAKNEIAVKVDNSFNEDIPTLTADFTFFGGIYRDVYLISTEAVHFDVNDRGSKGVFISTPKVSAESANVEVKSTVVNDGQTSKELKIISTIRDAEARMVAFTESSIQLDAGERNVLNQEIDFIQDPHLWSPDQPYLYQVTTAIYDADNKLMDEINNPLGFRWFEFDADKGFFLNGKSLKLIGTNRHQDYKDIGNALPNALHAQDVKLLKEMGGNFLRVAHYPHDPVVLETCDRLGILAAVEIPIVNTITESEAFYENSKNMQVEMIRQGYNHPSVIIWAYMNEVLLRPKFKNDKERQEKYFQNIAKLARELEEITRREDPYRYTMIPNHGSFDIYNKVGLTEIPMIVGWNLYPGWYSKYISDFAKFLDRHHEELPHKPMIVTEYGADADPRLRSFKPERFDKTVEYANLYHVAYLKEILERPFVAGATVWNLADFYSETRGDVVPHVNNKGLMGLDRVPKDTYFYYQAHLLKRPFLRIASRNWTVRGGIAKDESEQICWQPIEVYTNMDTAYLLVNGQKLIEKPAENKVVQWEVPFVNGLNIIEAVAKKDGQIYKDLIEVDFNLQPYLLKSGKLPFKEICINLGTMERTFKDELTKQIWLPDQPYREGSWGYIGGEQYALESNERQSYGTDQNIQGTDLDPVYQTQQVGIEQYKLDVPDGVYEVVLHFASLENEGERELLAYNLGSDAQVESMVMQRVFSVTVNRQPIFTNMDMVREYGTQREINRKIIVRSKNNEGITIDFDAIQGNAVLNGVEVKKVY